ncbi:hypothetical protein TSOC_004744 [Tetrabaena socialis]|uniref:Uncharacterized protein n=1 Tax=Tetrabaena socialis TaxID=47790 RepID=A0A2J8A893_9CHLO|nr:hypothetical protein TSOC_004744 [Tetrabaena socialis]|eukprot:PNH08693.1 hypothetical protein TSOC_004744 [Tetrabaena socialis]
MAPTVSTSSREDLDQILPSDIELFRRTLLARRFPGLSTVSDADVALLIAADRKATGRRLMLNVKTHPKTDFAPLKREPLERVVPFVPVNAHEAKVQSARGNTERFIGVDSPYEGHRTDFNTGRTTDERRRVAPFVPSCASQVTPVVERMARATVKINYTLNSPPPAEVPQSRSGSKPSSLQSTAQRG